MPRLVMKFGGTSVADLERIRNVAYSDSGTTTAAVNFPQLGLAPHEGCHRVLHIHRNEPGVLTKINELLSAQPGTNILGQHLQTLGNVGSVSLPLCFSMAEEAGFVRAGHRVAMFGIGSASPVRAPALCQSCRPATRFGPPFWFWPVEWR